MKSIYPNAKKVNRIPPACSKDTNEAKFLRELRSSDQSLDFVAHGRFPDKQHPLDYAYGLKIGAGLTRCECGLWGSVDDLLKDNVPIPCPHAPRRIQRKRTKGWRMPESIYVGRPTKWGNLFDWKALIKPPRNRFGFRILDPTVTENEAKRYTAKHFDHWLRTGEWKSLELVKNMTIPIVELEDRRQWILSHLHELRGENLACWCRLDQFCHVDTYLELANDTRDAHSIGILYYPRADRR